MTEARHRNSNHSQMLQSCQGLCRAFADVAELADATDSKSVELIPRVGSSPTIGTSVTMGASVVTQNKNGTHTATLFEKYFFIEKKSKNSVS